MGLFCGMSILSLVELGHWILLPVLKIYNEIFRVNLHARRRNYDMD